jgi:tetratricopeptide (TPR) repeat protein
VILPPRDEVVKVVPKETVTTQNVPKTQTNTSPKVEIKPKQSDTPKIIPSSNQSKKIQLYSDDDEREPLTIRKPDTSKNIDIDDNTFNMLANAAIGKIQHGIGDARVDKIIAMGYLKVNSGKLEEGIKIFTDLLKNFPETVAAYLGRGTAFALGGALDNAIDDFSAAIKINPKCLDAYKEEVKPEQLVVLKMMQLKTSILL